MPEQTGTILDRIVEATRRGSRDLFRSFDPDMMVEPEGEKPRGCHDFLNRGFGIVAEIKSGSPSLGLIRDPLSFEQRVLAYDEGGAAAISVVTEKDFFFGNIGRMDLARELSDLPILRKDFIVHPAMVYEAFSHGADWVLLIAAILTDTELAYLMDCCRRLGLVALVEVHDHRELDRVLPMKPDLLGLNNRSLNDFSVSLDRCLELKRVIPDDLRVIAESGVRSKQDIERLKQAGFAGALVGESLMRRSDPDGLLRAWLA